MNFLTVKALATKFHLIFAMDLKWKMSSSGGVYIQLPNQGADGGFLFGRFYL
jgi:hypothetical protein